MSRLDELLKELCPNGVEYKTIEEIAVDIYRGSGIKRDELTESGIPCVRYGEIYTTYDVWFDKCVSHTKEENVKSPKYFEEGDILFAITGESVEDIAKSTAEYYRNSLLTFNKEIPCVKLKEVATIERGTRVVRNQLEETGTYPVYQNALTPMGYYSGYNRLRNNTFMICAGAAGQIGYAKTDFWAADDCYTFKCKNDLDNKYLYYVLKNNQHRIDAKVRKASIPRISREAVGNILLPLPSIEAQKKIVYVLDNFDSICSDLNVYESIDAG